MKRLYIVALLLALTVCGFAQRANNDQIRFQGKDTTKITWNLDDSSYVKTSLAGQLIEWILRNNDYDASNGVHIEVRSPDGDSVLSGLWFGGDGTNGIYSQGLLRLSVRNNGITSYSNFRVRPAWDGTAPKLIFESLAGDSTTLSLGANNFVSVSRGLNLGSTSNPNPATGDVWRAGNFHYEHYNGVTWAYDYSVAPTNGKIWKHDGVAFRLQNDASDSSNPGGGFTSLRWDSLTPPAVDLSMDHAATQTRFLFGDPGARPSLWFSAYAGSGSEPTLRVSNDESVVRPIAEFVTYVADEISGVYVNSTGTLKKVGVTGHVSADQWLDKDTVARANLPPTLVFNDKPNIFTSSQTISGASATQMLDIANSNAGASNGVFSSIAGSGAAVSGFTSNASGTGVQGSSSSGTGIIANSNTGIPLKILFNSALKASLTSVGLIPAASGGYDLGSWASHIGNLHVDSLFAGTGTDSTRYLRADGTQELHPKRAILWTADTMIVNIAGVDSNYDATWGYIGKPPVGLYAPGGKCYNGGNVELTSGNTPMVGNYTWYKVWKRN